jgi:DNA-binding CsgD family transcriptional regulator
MISVLFTVAFVLCAGLTAGSILLAVSLRKKNHTPLFSSLLYFLAFYFTFGFYAIWGQVIMVSLMQGVLSAAVIRKANAILVLLGAPFFLFAFTLLTRMACEATGRKVFPVTVGMLSLNLLSGVVLFFLARLGDMDVLALAQTGFIALTLLNTGISSLLLLVAGKRPLLGKTDRLRLAVGILLFSLVQCILLWFSGRHVAVLATFMLVFFVGGAYLPVYLWYVADLSAIRPPGSRFDLAELCRMYDISAREQDVVREICNGLSNQQIADKLFISLQTVKDHTSRIYYKTNCSGRAMLISMVQHSEKTKS